MNSAERKAGYFDFIKHSNNRELYDYAKKYLIQQYSGYGRNSWKCELIYEECRRRGLPVFEDAVADSLLFVNSIEFRSGNMKVVDLVRIDHMSNSDLLTYVNRNFHAGWNNPDIGSGEMDRAGIFKTFGIDEDTIVCKVSGSSMVGARIFDGDTLIANTKAEAKSGDIVIVNLDGETFVKRYLFKGDEVFLISENPEYGDIRVSEESIFNILGVVTGSLTNF